MDILPFQPEHIQPAAEMFARSFQALREQAPALPPAMAGYARVAEVLAKHLQSHPSLVALRDGRLVGYLCWFIVPNLRAKGRIGAYVPEWGHGVSETDKRPAYRALYRAASAQWAERGCRLHAITLLATDRGAEQAWFWNGFGLGVIDAVRPITPIDAPLPQGVRLRLATLADAALLSALEAEHWQHYLRPPIFMVAQPPSSAAEIAEFLADEKNAYWLAETSDGPAGFLRFEGGSFEGADSVSSASGVMLTGAYVRPAFRGRGILPALLDTGLRDFAARGFERCTVDFESFNPEAANLWPRYLQPVCYSLLRVPETCIAAPSA